MTNQHSVTHIGGAPLTVVTGGASGIGLACVRRLLSRGDRVAVMDLAGQKDNLEDLAGAIAFHSCDVADEEQVRSVAADIIRSLGPVRNLVNSAGIIQKPVAPEELDIGAWDKVVSVDQRGTYVCCLAFGRQMALGSGGSIVNVASIAGSRSMPLHAYSPAKAAVISISQCLAAEWGRSGVRVNSVSPGYTVTPALQSAIDRGDRDPTNLVQGAALGRMVRPEEIAAAVDFLTSDNASAITGIDLPVDAGWLVGISWATYGGLPPARVVSTAGL